MSSHPIGLDSKLIGNLAVPLLSIGGSIITGKLIGDALEGRHPLGLNTLVHTSVVPHGHGHGLGLGLNLGLPNLGLALPALGLGGHGPALKLAH